MFAASLNVNPYLWCGGGGSEISAQTHMAAAMWPKDASLGSRQEGALKLDWRAGRSLGCG